MASESGVSLSWGGLDKALNKATAGISDTRKLMTRIGAAMKGQTVRRFSQGEGPDGQPWKKSRRVESWRADTKRDSKGRFKKDSGKKSSPPEGQTLVDTARLRASISFSAAPLEAHVGSNVVYARIHQLGGQAGRGRKITLPARPYLGLSADDREEIEALVAAHLEKSFK